MVSGSQSRLRLVSRSITLLQLTSVGSTATIVSRWARLSRVVTYEAWQNRRQTFLYRITRQFSWDVRRTPALQIRNARGNKIPYLCKPFFLHITVIRVSKIRKYAPRESRVTQVLSLFFSMEKGYIDETWKLWSFGRVISSSLVRWKMLMAIARPVEVRWRAVLCYAGWKLNSNLNLKLKFKW